MSICSEATLAKMRHNFNPCRNKKLFIMKQLSKIKLQNSILLEEQEMKRIYGGSGYSWCCIQGECVGPLISCTSDYCEKHYGSGAYCD